jgi:CDP-glycerol glycerophosphotransferase (TagB/SpsB family)
MDFDNLLDRLEEDYFLILKKHPSMKKSSFQLPHERNLDRFLDLSNENVNNLMMISDILINDYSSTFFEAALLGKPVVFLTKDLDEYLDDRGFYFDFRTFVPGPICPTEAILAEEVKKNIGHPERVSQFVAEYFGEVPKDNASRLARFIVDYINRDGMNRVKKKVSSM